MSVAVQRSDTVYDGTTSNAQLVVQYASVSVAGSGDNTLVSATSGKKIRVLGGCLVAAAAVTAQFQSGAANANLTGAMSLITGTPLMLPPSQYGHFQTNAGDGLHLSLGGAVQVSGWIAYVLV